MARHHRRHAVPNLSTRINRSQGTETRTHESKKEPCRKAGTFATTPDDQRCLMVRDNSWDDMAGTRTMVVVENFFEELRAKLKK